MCKGVHTRAMTTTRGTRFPLHSQADKAAELDRLDQIISHWSERAKVNPKMVKYARKAESRRRKVSGWVVGG